MLWNTCRKPNNTCPLHISSINDRVIQYKNMYVLTFFELKINFIEALLLFTLIIMAKQIDATARQKHSTAQIALSLYSSLVKGPERTWQMYATTTNVIIIRCNLYIFGGSKYSVFWFVEYQDVRSVLFASLSSAPSISCELNHEFLLAEWLNLRLMLSVML